MTAQANSESEISVVDTTCSLPPEQICCFGDDSQLVGVYTRPVDANKDSVCALYLTAGLLHHVGPTRLHVEMARQLSLSYVSGLRFDFSGVGDSETSTLGGYFTERSVKEVKMAMDYLQSRFGHTRFILIGLCSGADDALATAQVDSRVVGLVLLDGYAYRAGHYKLYQVKELYLPRILSAKKWKGRIRRLLSRALGSLKLTSESSRTQATATENSENVVDLSDADKAAIVALDDDYRCIPPQEEMGRILAMLTEQKKYLYFIYSGSEYDTYTYEGQLFAMFPELVGNPYVRESYIKEADHTFFLKQDRTKIINWVQDWVENSNFDHRE